MCDFCFRKAFREGDCTRDRSLQTSNLGKDSLLDVYVQGDLPSHGHGMPDTLISSLLQLSGRWPLRLRALQLEALLWSQQPVDAHLITPSGSGASNGSGLRSRSEILVPALGYAEAFWPVPNAAQASPR